MERIKRNKHYILTLISMIGLFLYTLFSPLIFAEVGIGGFASEKTIGNNQNLWIGTGTDLPVIGMGAPATILSPVDTTMSDTTYATLRGRVTSMSGFPSATLWFEWGYKTTALTNTTPIQTITAIGIYTADISGYDPNETVYYRMATNTDGTLYTATTSFMVGTVAAQMYRLLWNLLPLILAIAVLMWTIMEKRMELIWIAIVIYVIGTTIVNVMLTLTW